MTIDIERPLLVGFMLGEVAHDRLVRPERTQPGDAILLTKGIAVEGASIIAREKGEELTAKSIAPDVISRAQRLLREPGINVLREARLAADAGAHILHDPTEGGLATAIWELCEASHLGARIERQAIPLIPEAEALCAAYGLDPLGTIASGALLIGIAAEKAAGLQAQIEAQGIRCARIGSFVAADEGVTLDCAPMPRFDSDEITRIFE
jgi:hydrogenase maturation factor